MKIKLISTLLLIFGFLIWINGRNKIEIISFKKIPKDSFLYLKSLGEKGDYQKFKIDQSQVSLDWGYSKRDTKSLYKIVIKDKTIQSGHLTIGETQDLQIKRSEID